MRTIDLNCDMGEGCGNDAELMKYISSANVACGFHAGDAGTMRATVELAVRNNVAVGAHPGYRDLENFGRRPLELSSNEVFDIVTEQIETMADVCKESGIPLHHVKPHGALYNQAARDRELAAAIANAVFKFDQDLILYGLSGSFLVSAAEELGLRTASEVFADRTYRADGGLTPRTEANALVTEQAQAVAQALQMIREGTVTASTGETVAIRADTVCLHGDGEHAVEFAQSLRHTFDELGIEVSAVGK